MTVLFHLGHLRVQWTAAVNLVNNEIRDSQMEVTLGGHGEKKNNRKLSPGLYEAQTGTSNKCLAVDIRTFRNRLGVLYNETALREFSGLIH